jgi:hypothetical protein
LTDRQGMMLIVPIVETDKKAGIDANSSHRASSSALEA